MNDHRDIKVQLENKFDEDIDFCLKRIAHFNASPAQDVIEAHSSSEFTITFKPKNFGTFSRQIDIELLHSQYKLPIKLVANSHSHRKKVFHRRGIHCLPEHFGLKEKIVDEELLLASMIPKKAKKKLRRAFKSVEMLHGRLKKKDIASMSLSEFYGQYEEIIKNK